MKILELMGVLGIPSIIAILGYIITIGKRINILMNAVQAQMRRDLMCQYHKHKAAGFISEDDMKEWENQYSAYHSLGKNGIMDARREELIKLPSHL